MKFIDESAMKRCRNRGKCELCGAVGPTDSHHAFSRGVGGGTRVDLDCFLLAVCREWGFDCHGKIHRHPQFKGEAMLYLAWREKTTTDALKELFWWINRQDKNTPMEAIESKMKELFKRVVGKGVGGDVLQ